MCISGPHQCAYYKRLSYKKKIEIKNKTETFKWEIMYSCPIKIQIKQEWDNTTRVSNLYMTTGAVPFQMIAYTFVPKWCMVM